MVTPDYQINIWYIEYMDCWATADKKGALHIWDLLTNEIKQSFYPKHETKEPQRYIMDLAEIEYVKLVATASADKHITLWDLNKGNIIFSINMIKGGVHQIKFFATYQVLLIAGYDNAIPVFSVTPTYYDLNICGRLIGHLHIVTAIECIENSPMVITADDNGTIKTWDIRSFQCCQTIGLSRKTLITK